MFDSSDSGQSFFLRKERKFGKLSLWRREKLGKLSLSVEERETRETLSLEKREKLGKLSLWRREKNSGNSFLRDGKNGILFLANLFPNLTIANKRSGPRSARLIIFQVNRKPTRHSLDFLTQKSPEFGSVEVPGAAPEVEHGNAGCSISLSVSRKFF
ncbi:MAG: hypothetical protein AB7W16_24745 [Candidatus Obscuribacterales bacterium]